MFNPLSPGTIIGEDMGREREVLASTFDGGYADYLVLTKYGLYHYLVEWIDDMGLSGGGLVTVTMNSYTDKDKAEEAYTALGGKF